MHRLLQKMLPAFLALTLMPGAVSANIFPDVPDGHMYQAEIELLVGAGVVKGNPDGLFHVDREVNRAEMLTMLYRAKGIIPGESSRLCFKDVVPDSWYEAIVCDAAAKGFVVGYADGTFKPEQKVNRVEALQMIAKVFGVELPQIRITDRDVVNFVDVSQTAWYVRPMYWAFKSGVLPIRGQEGPRFYPDKAMTRGEAAVYIHNALQLDMGEEMEEEESEEGTTVLPDGDTFDVEFPFDLSGTFTGKKSVTIRFDLTSPVVASTVANTPGDKGRITCRLYLLGENGFSDEYYLGYEEGQSCSLLTALRPGSYQLQITPTEPDVAFTVSSKEGHGDGNDGFREAIMMGKDELVSGTLQPGDLVDWYTFSLSAEKSQKLEFASETNLRCTVYAMNDVDWYGFEGPNCNVRHQYAAGTYYVAVIRASLPLEQQGYSLILKP